MVYNWQKDKMKKAFLILLLTIVTLIASAIPSGSYYSMGRRGNIRYDSLHMTIFNGTLHMVEPDGTITLRWEILGESYDSENNVTWLSLGKNEAGVSARAYWWNEDGKTYLTVNNTTFVLK